MSCSVHEKGIASELWMFDQSSVCVFEIQRQIFEFVWINFLAFEIDLGALNAQPHLGIE